MMNAVIRLAILIFVFSTLVPSGAFAAPNVIDEKPNRPSIEDSPSLEVDAPESSSELDQEAAYDLSRPEPMKSKKLGYELNLDTYYSKPSIEPLPTAGILFGIGLTYRPSYEGFYGLNALYSPSKVIIFRLSANTSLSNFTYWRALFEHQNDPAKGLNSFVSLDHYSFGLGLLYRDFLSQENLNFIVDMLAGLGTLKFNLGLSYSLP